MTKVTLKTNVLLMVMETQTTLMSKPYSTLIMMDQILPACSNFGDALGMDFGNYSTAVLCGKLYKYILRFLFVISRYFLQYESNGAYIHWGPKVRGYIGNLGFVCFI